MRKMGIGLGVGINRSNYAQGIFNAYSARVVADGGVVESGTCVDAVSSLLQSASLLLIPSGYKGGKLYAEIPTNGNGDLTWTRTSTANRTNASGNIELMATGVPRLSYMYGSCPSALLEPQRTNLALYSDQFNTGWTQLNSSITANTTTSPDGSTNADSLIENSLLAEHNIIQNITVANATAYTCSVYFKANTRTKAAIQLAGTAFASGGNGISIFDLSSGTVVSSVNGATATITSVGNGWYRCTSTKTTASTVGIVSYNLIDASNNLTYTGNGTSGVFLYGAQLELGAYATTLIPTTTASATRVADSFSRNNIYTNGLISASGGTWFVELRGNVSLIADNAPSGFWLGTSSTGTISNGTLYFRQGGGSQRTNVWKYESGTATQLYITTTDTTKIAIKWNGTTADIFENGTKVVSGTAFTATSMEFLTSTGVGRPFFIQQMALFPTPLTDAQLQALTS